MKKRLIVAHYNENLNWLDQIKEDIDIFIYHKYHDKLLSYNDKINLNKNEFLLSNVGRESHTYLKHIIDNYDDLYDIEYFSQGYPDHFKNFTNIINDDIIEEYKQYSDHPISFKCISGKIPTHMIYAPEGAYPCTLNIWKNIFDIEPPKEVEIIPHALIKINKESILQHDKEIYLKCLKYFEDNKIDNKYAWTFEYFWALLFNKNNFL